MTLRQVIDDLREEARKAAREERARVSRFSWWDRWLARRIWKRESLRYAGAAHYEGQALVAMSNRLLQRARFDALSLQTFDEAPTQPTRSQPATSVTRLSRRR
jgi:hypothetical protein